MKIIIRPKLLNRVLAHDVVPPGAFCLHTVHFSENAVFLPLPGVC